MNDLASLVRYLNHRSQFGNESDQEVYNEFVTKVFQHIQSPSLIPVFANNGLRFAVKRYISEIPSLFTETELDEFRNLVLESEVNFEALLAALRAIRVKAINLLIQNRFLDMSFQDYNALYTDATLISIMHQSKIILVLSMIYFSLNYLC